MSAGYPYRLFERLGLELEYMVVDASLDVLPIVDQVLHAQGGSYDGEVAVGPVSWSNELVLHVLELKTTEPAASLQGWAATFQEHVGLVNAALARPGGGGVGALGRLLPTGMHPWMDPNREMRLWPHDNSEVYRAFNRVFDCRGHGWANLQSVHVNLPFADDDRPDSEFGRLHAAVRLLLPIMPALSASSPVMDGRATGTLDNRLAVYKANARRIPAVTGRVIPEPVFTREQYERTVLAPLYTALSPHDPDGVLRHEWANARGAIARFERGAIEVRVLDVQECPAADLAIVGAIIGVLRSVVAEQWQSLEGQQAWPAERLACILDAVIVEGERTSLDDTDYLRAFGWTRGPTTAGQLWHHLAHTLELEQTGTNEPLGTILDHGPLSRRILRALGAGFDHKKLREVYARLADCLRDGRVFRADA